MKVRAIILGCGSSGGVPRIGGPDGRGDWGACDPDEPRNRRTRCSILVQRACDERGWEADALTTVLIDTAPELRLQMTREGCGHVDAVFYTHDHADQTHGIDDLRAVAINARAQVPVYYSPTASPDLTTRFAYCFERQADSPYPAILDARVLPPPGDAVLVEGPTGTLPVTSFTQAHGHVPSLGFRAGPIAYSPDLSDLPDESFETLRGAHVWIVDALRYTPHPSHAHLDKTLGWIRRSGVEQGVLTNLHIDMDYGTLQAELPESVRAAYDGLTITASD